MTLNQLITLQWRHNEPDGISNHRPHDCLLNRLFRRRSQKTSKLRVTGLCAGNSPLTGEFPAQMASNADNVSIWWRHHVWTHNRTKHNGTARQFYGMHWVFCLQRHSILTPHFIIDDAICHYIFCVHSQVGNSGQYGHWHLARRHTHRQAYVQSTHIDIDGLVQDCSALAMQILQSCTKLSL